MDCRIAAAILQVQPHRIYNTDKSIFFLKKAFLLDSMGVFGFLKVPKLRQISA